MMPDRSLQQKMKQLKSKDSNSQFKGIINVSYLHLIIRMVVVWYGGNSCGHIEEIFSMSSAVITEKGDCMPSTQAGWKRSAGQSEWVAAQSCNPSLTVVTSEMSIMNRDKCLTYLQVYTYFSLL